MKTITRYDLTVEIPAEVEEEGDEAVATYSDMALDEACRAKYRVPLAQLDAEVAQAIATVPALTEEQQAEDPIGSANAREQAVKAVVAVALEKATARISRLPSPPAPTSAEED